MLRRSFELGFALSRFAPCGRQLGRRMYGGATSQRDDEVDLSCVSQQEIETSYSEGFSLTIPPVQTHVPSGGIGSVDPFSLHLVLASQTLARPQI